MFLPEGEDPDSMVRQVGKDGFEQYMRNALPLSEFFYETLLDKADIRKLDGKAKLLQLAKPYVNQLKDGGFRSLLIERLAAGAGVPSAEIMRQYGINTGPKLAPRKTPATFTRGQQEVSSLVRKAITLLLHRPKLAAQVHDAAELSQIQLPGTLLLVELLEFFSLNPTINTAALLEHWRGREDERQLARLAMEEVYIPEEGQEQEFLDAIRQIRNLGSEIELDLLLKKSQYAELTPEEKRSLRELLTRHTAPSEA
jgi:DNA primase